MLRNRYQEILVGLNLMSLVRGIISLKRSRTTLLIHDSRFSADTYPQGFLSELEILSLIRLGKKYDIPELSDIREFLTPASISLVSNQCRVVIGSTPFENLRELLRKYPELIDASDLDLVYQEGERDLGSWFIEEATRFEKSCYDWANKPKGLYFEL